MEKTIALRNTEITFSIWDLGGTTCSSDRSSRCSHVALTLYIVYACALMLLSGHREFISMLPLVCNDAVAILFMFDLSRKATLTSVKEWYRQVRSINKVRLMCCLRMRHDVVCLYAPLSLTIPLCVCLWISLSIECVSVPHWHEVRPLYQLLARRARGHHKTGASRARNVPLVDAPTRCRCSLSLSHGSNEHMRRRASLQKR